MLRDLAQPSHLLILAVLIVVLFGWKKLPDAARSVGRSMRIFKSEMSEMKSDGKESKPSPAATDTVTGVVPPHTTAQTTAQGTAQGTGQTTAQTAAQAADRPTGQQTPQAASHVPSQNGSVDASVGQPQGGQPARHDNPAL